MKNNAIHSTDWKVFPGFAVAVLISLCSTPIVLSQTITGVASGSVADLSGQAVAGAAVTLTNEDTRDARRTETDPTGSFVFPAVLPGKYTVTVEAKGFQTLQRTGNHLTANERLSFGKLQLAIGSVSESVTVSAQGVNVNTASSEGSALLTTRHLLSMLLNRCQAGDKEKVLERLKKISPVAWQHIHFLGHYLFRDNRPIDLEAILEHIDVD